MNPSTHMFIFCRRQSYSRRHVASRDHQSLERLPIASHFLSSPAAVSDNCEDNIGESERLPMRLIGEDNTTGTILRTQSALASGFSETESLLRVTFSHPSVSITTAPPKSQCDVYTVFLLLALCGILGNGKETGSIAILFLPQEGRCSSPGETLRQCFKLLKIHCWSS